MEEVGLEKAEACIPDDALEGDEEVERLHQQHQRQQQQEDEDDDDEEEEEEEDEEPVLVGKPAPPSRRPGTPAVLLELDDNSPRRRPNLQPEAPRFGDRPDLNSSVTFGTAAFRGSATPTSLQGNSRTYISGVTPVVKQEAFAPVPPQSPSSRRGGFVRPISIAAVGNANGRQPVRATAVSSGGYRASLVPTAPVSTPTSGLIVSSMPLTFPASSTTPTNGSIGASHVSTVSVTGGYPTTGGYSGGSVARRGAPMVAEIGTDGGFNVPQAALPTPTNGDRKIMLTRSSRGARGAVLVARADQAPDSPVNRDHYAGSPEAERRPDGTPSTISPGVSPPDSPVNGSSSGTNATKHKSNHPTLVVRAVAPGIQDGTACSGLWAGLATPTNRDRVDLACSLSMGIPAFRGSAGSAKGGYVSGAQVGPPIAALKSPVSLGAPSGDTPVRCFPRN